MITILGLTQLKTPSTLKLLAHHLVHIDLDAHLPMPLDHLLPRVLVQDLPQPKVISLQGQHQLKVINLQDQLQLKVLQVQFHLQMKRRIQLENKS